MYVCVCRAVTDRQIRDAAQSGVRTLEDLRRELGVCSGCGQCAAVALECIKQSQSGECQSA